MPTLRQVQARPNPARLAVRTSGVSARTTERVMGTVMVAAILALKVTFVAAVLGWI